MYKCVVLPAARRLRLENVCTTWVTSWCCQQSVRLVIKRLWVWISAGHTA